LAFDILQLVNFNVVGSMGSHFDCLCYYYWIFIFGTGYLYGIIVCLGTTILKSAFMYGHIG